MDGARSDNPVVEWVVNRSLETLSTISAFWALLLGAIFLWDIIGREAFNAPLGGTHEIVGNSIVGILFLQLPSSIRRGAMLRTELVYQAVNDFWRRSIDSVSYVFGIVLFAVMAYAQWDPMIVGWQIGEIEGAGAANIPVYPVRTVIVVFSAICALVYVQLLYFTVTKKIAPAQP